MKRSMLALSVVVFGLTQFAPAARATNSVGYVCTAHLMAAPAALPMGLGNYGYIYFSLYAGAGCTGTFQGGGYLCSTGATSTTYCSSQFLYSEMALNTLFSGLLKAAVAGSKVSASGTQSLTYYLFFYGSGF
jgi:hypothetical protein